MLLSTIGHRLYIHTPYRTNVSNLQYNKPKHEPNSFINSQVISYECLQPMYLSNSQQPHSTFFLFGTPDAILVNLSADVAKNTCYILAQITYVLKCTYWWRKLQTIKSNKGFEKIYCHGYDVYVPKYIGKSNIIQRGLRLKCMRELYTDLKKKTLNQNQIITMQVIMWMVDKPIPIINKILNRKITWQWHSRRLQFRWDFFLHIFNVYTVIQYTLTYIIMHYLTYIAKWHLDYSHYLLSFINNLLVILSILSMKANNTKQSSIVIKINGSNWPWESFYCTAGYKWVTSQNILGILVIRFQVTPKTQNQFYKNPDLLYQLDLIKSFYFCLYESRSGIAGSATFLVSRAKN
ncbi:hypothetical protein AGLY_012818 [Aphis glycines]|uniref:Uncharacterized protein n=1 Tax=Aphis glycines TaxID=307491 RepID=A0A6G0T883_APHGL|nr:hypothetical protein AGLY_012818 [Aphis glycines]